jgi:hypothetical protein
MNALFRLRPTGEDADIEIDEESPSKRERQE